MSALLDRLDKVKQTGSDRWAARCPGPLHVHGDRRPSLSIRLTDDGKWLIKCFAGCGAADVVAAVGLEMADEMPAWC